MAKSKRKAARSAPPQAPPRPPAPVAPPERWTRLVHLVPVAALLVFVGIGSRPGGEAAIRLYRIGPPAAGLLAAFALALALGWSLWRRPVLQPGRVLAYLSLGATLWLTSFPLAYPSSHDGRFSTVRFSVPVEGPWVVRWGGAERKGNALVLDPSRRHGFDLVRVDPATGEGSMAASLGARVLAPAEGAVVAVEPDGDGRIGAHLVLQVGDGQFLFLGSLDPASIQVERGARVARGDVLACVGVATRSRLSPGPHLAIHLQDSLIYGTGEAIPMRFHDLLVDGRAVDSSVPEGGLEAGRHVGQRLERLP